MSLRKIALVGGDEFRRGCEAMDTTILEATGARRPRVSVVPTAAAAQNPAKAASNGVSYFSSLGADASAVMALGPADAADPGLIAPLAQADVVYLTGGDPAHLLRTLRGSLLLDALRGRAWPAARWSPAPAPARWCWAPGCGTGAGSTRSASWAA